MPDFLLYVTGHVGRKPYLYMNRLSLEDTEARPMIPGVSTKNYFLDLKKSLCYTY
jgi:hypothetical protein